MSTHPTTSRRRTRRAVLGLAALPVVAAPFVAVSSAQAVPGLVTPQVTSVQDSSASKVVTVACPTGTRAIGGSALIGGTTKARINTEVPSSSAYTVLAQEIRGGTTASWYVVATADCAPVASVPGLEYVTVSSAYDSTSSHRATASCSPHKLLIGLGGGIDSNGVGQDKLVLTTLRPNNTLSSVTSVSYEDSAGFTGPWRTSATAVCTDNLGQVYASAATAVDGSKQKFAEAMCPVAAGIHSGGFDLSSGGGRVGVLDSFLDYGTTRTGFSAYGQADSTIGSNTWRVATFAICAP